MHGKCTIITIIFPLSLPIMNHRNSLPGFRYLDLSFKIQAHSSHTKWRCRMQKEGKNVNMAFPPSHFCPYHQSSSFVAALGKKALISQLCLSINRATIAPFNSRVRPMAKASTSISVRTRGRVGGLSSPDEREGDEHGGSGLGL